MAEKDKNSSSALSKRKPFRLLKAMEKQEIERFASFLSAPAFQLSLDNSLILLFEHCHQHKVWDLDWSKADLEASMGTNWTDNGFDKLVSRLYNQLLQFAALSEFMAQPAEHPAKTMRYLIKNGIGHEEVEKKMREGKRQIEKMSENGEYFRNRLELELENAKVSQSRKLSPEQRGLHHLHQSLDHYYITLKLRFLCASANEARIFGVPNQLNSQQQLLNWVASQYGQLPALAKIYYHTFQLLNEGGNNSQAAALKAQLAAWEAQSLGEDQQELSEIKGYLLNYHLRQINKGDLESLAISQELYQEALDQAWILEAGLLPPEHFKNLIQLKCRCNLVPEARAFYENYKNQLTHTQDHAAWDFNHALLLLHEGKTKASIAELERLLDEKGSIKADQYYGIDLRCMLMKAYLQLMLEKDAFHWDNADEKLANLNHAFSGYLVRRNLPPSSQLRFENFRKSILKLFHVGFNIALEAQTNKLAEALEEFQSADQLPDKGWFIAYAAKLLEAQEA